VVECCRAALEGPFITAQQLSSVGSPGTVAYPEQGLTIGDLLRRADAAMYREKARRRLGLEARDPTDQFSV